jgi:hypothetical protein
MQLKLNSNFYILNFLNNTFAIDYIILRSVYTFYNMMIVLFRQELFM